MIDEHERRIDEEWKRRIEEEKKAAQEEAKPEILEPSFLALVSSLSMQAMINLGVIEDPISKKASVDLAQARYAIDLLQVLEDKAKGNLDTQESEVLKNTLHELRMLYVTVADKQSGKT